MEHIWSYLAHLCVIDTAPRVIITFFFKVFCAFPFGNDLIIHPTIFLVLSYLYKIHDYVVGHVLFIPQIVLAALQV